MRRRRKGSKGTWFPILGSRWVGEGNTYHTTAIPIRTTNLWPRRDLGTQLDGPYALTKDYTLEPGDDVSQEHSLRDYVNGQDWLLQRIVGKVHLRVRNETTATTPAPSSAVWPFVQVVSGFFVARAEDEDQAVCELEAHEVDPTHVDNAQNPWIWRRTWMLRTPGVFTDQTTLTSQSPYATEGDFPIANSGYGSIMDGPHIDSKVKRRIRREERLWFVTSAIGWNGSVGIVTPGSNEQPFVQGELDIRIFGSLRRAKNSSSF